MTPVARAQEAQPAGAAEARLLAAVDSYESVAAFCRAVAVKTKKTPSSEESAFYRIIRGHIGDKTGWRIRIYAELLGKDATEFLRPPELPTVRAIGSGPVAPRNLQEVAAALTALTGRVEGLVERVADLEKRVPAKTRQAGRAR